MSITSKSVGMSCTTLWHFADTFFTLQFLLKKNLDIWYKANMVTNCTSWFPRFHGGRLLCGGVYCTAKIPWSRQNLLYTHKIPCVLTTWMWPLYVILSDSTSNCSHPVVKNVCLSVAANMLRHELLLVTSNQEKPLLEITPAGDAEGQAFLLSHFPNYIASV